METSGTGSYKGRNGRRGWRGALVRSLQWVLLFVFAAALVIAQAPAKKSAAKKPSILPVPAAPATTTPATPEPPPEDPLGRSTPRGCVLGFLRAAEAKDFERAARFLDSDRPQAETEELAVQLKSLMDRGTATDLNTLSRVPEGDLDEDMRPTRERVGVVSTPGGALDVLLDRVQRPEEGKIWLFSKETLRHVPAAYVSTRTVPHRDLSTYFPDWMVQHNLFAMPLWRWVLLVGALLVVLLAASVLTRIALRLLKLGLHGRLTQAMEARVLNLRGPIFGLMTAIVERSLSGYALTVLWRHWWAQISLLTALISLAWLVIRLTDIFVLYARHQFTMRMQIERVTVVGLLGRMFKIFVGVVLVLSLLALAGVNVQALVAGLGIGGVALALAAQKTLSDLFGGISVIMRGAVRVGDMCTIVGRQGTVEEIGISALRMRTLDRTVVSIPNSKVAEADLENFTMRDQFWVHQVFTLRFDSSYAVVQKVLARMKQVLDDHPDIDPKTSRVRLLQLTNAGPQVEMFAYHRKPGTDYAGFLAEQEPIILAMMRIVEEEGTAMVAPVPVIELHGPEKQGPGTRDQGLGTRD
jgi:MscS family membrane protein